MQKLARVFSPDSNNISLSKEIIAGFTTFFAMSYILVVNPQILGSTGMDPISLVTVTALSTALGTLIMGAWARLPVGLAPGMGGNAIFAYIVVGQMGMTWQVALTMVFFTGIVFIFLSLSRLREKLIDGFPREIQLGLQLSIGIFIAFLGLKNGGLVIANPATFVAFGDLSYAPTALAFFGLFLTIVLYTIRIPGALLLSIIILTITGLFINDSQGNSITSTPAKILSIPMLSSELIWAFDFDAFYQNIWLLLPIALYFLLGDFFSTAATLLSVVSRANLLTTDGKIPRAKQAFTADAIATTTGAMMGTSTVSSYIESLTGIEAGGRTGLTSVVVAVLFILAIFFSPLISVVPIQATAPVLFLVGVIMLTGVRTVDTTNELSYLPPLLMLAITAITANFMVSLCVGSFSYTLLALLQRKWSKITLPLTVINIILIIFLAINTSL